MTLSYDSAGQNNTTPLIFLHAFPINRKMWRYQLESLSDIAHVITPDLPGFGESPILSNKPPSMKEYALCLQNFMQAKSLKKAIFAGCSMGGYIIFELWRMNPSLFSGIILIDTRAEADDEDARNTRTQSINVLERQGSNPIANLMPQKALGDTTQKNNPTLVDEIKQTIAATSPEGIIYAQKAMIQRQDSTDTLKSINVPTLIIVGEEDTITPIHLAESMNQLIANSTLTMIPKAGHLCPIEQPQAVNAAIIEYIKNKVS